MNAMHQEKITFGQFANSYILFGLLLVIALILPEITLDPDLYRTNYTIWNTTFLLIPALCLYMFRGVSHAVDNYWRLMWTFSLLSFLVHFYYGTFVELDGFGDTFDVQGPVVASTNFLLTFWWTLDVILLWSLKSKPRWASIQRLILIVVIFILFTVGNIVLKSEAILPLGIAFTALITLSFCIRLYIIPLRQSKSSDH